MSRRAPLPVPARAFALAAIIAMGLATRGPLAHGQDAQAATATAEGSAPGAGSAGAASTRVPLEDVLSRVPASAPTVVAARAQIDGAFTRLQEARAGSWPTIRATAGVAPAPRIRVDFDDEGRPITSSDDRTELDLLDDITSLGWRAEVTVTVPLTTFGRLRLARQAARVGIDDAELQAHVTLREAEYEAVRAYTALQWYERFDRLLTEAEDRLDEAEEELEIALDDGDRTARTAIRQLTIARASFADLRADADAVAGTARYALETALDLPAGFRPERFDTDIDPNHVPPLDEVLAVARANRDDYRRLDEALAAAELQRRIRRREFAPEIGVNISMNGAWTPTVTDLRGPFVYDPYNRFSLGVALGLQWNLNVARNIARVDRADADIDRILAERDAAWLGIELEVTEAYHQVVGELRSLEAWVAAERAADAWLDQVGFQYDQGLAEYSEFEEPLKSYYQTHGAWLKAVLDTRLAFANLALKTGSADWTGWPTR